MYFIKYNDLLIMVIINDYLKITKWVAICQHVTLHFPSSYGSSNLWNFPSAMLSTICIYSMYKPFIVYYEVFFPVLQMEHICRDINFTFKGTKFAFKGTL